MKIFKFKFAIQLIAVSALFASCSKDFIEKLPEDAVSSSTAITDKSSMQSALNGAYAELRALGIYGADLPIMGDLLADNSFVQTGNTGRFLTTYQYTFINDDGYYSAIWNNSYTTILRANNIINATASGDQTAIDALKAEAHAIRGLVYFNLVNIYARNYDDTTGYGVPIVLEDNPANKPGRSTIGQVYNQIISDFQTSLSSVREYSSSITISKYAVEALLAKAYFYSRQYDKALSAAKDVIDNSGFTLAGTPAAYASFWANAAAKSDQVEVLFEVDADATDNNGASDLGRMYVNGYNDIYCDSTFYRTYSATDVRRTLLLDGATKVGKATHVVNKYPNGANTDRDNIKVIRLAEVYLIAAESAARLEQTSVALTYLNTLAQTRDNSLAAYALSGQTLIDTIIEERRKELAFEGNRFSDLNRLGLTITRRVNQGGLSISSNYLSVPYADYRRIGPIPYTEIKANSTLATQQNPSY
ncbi:RagB/SusD family nutrient uptake outer membrane protein [Chitinophaga sancti]|uniref:RagB/SusD family nutrient uptake outer membrane protein n=1 Tax=Chitinophaga sancti TaxID=1004 RepID=A0A1K1SX73_9BACT|nr:RagB/SusD family nutrient uptake outer membrane protein [Chitinophaga sancti]WQD62286.1 RagB/SusD family nutrient uptake outer membrane protein [Chitinophaga sancti]WQG92145.1 RagB/SusD family nutrient uptake outer membrane protein [Chitinophaga sancti]SFW88992.1 SusD family protein [Chitinophaga sancti]